MAGKGGRPSIIVTSAFEILLGNEDNAKITLDASELFGSLGSMSGSSSRKLSKI